MLAITFLPRANINLGKEKGIGLFSQLTKMEKDENKTKQNKTKQGQYSRLCRMYLLINETDFRAQK